MFFLLGERKWILNKKFGKKALTLLGFRLVIKG
jgi:hypothetical protein